MKISSNFDNLDDRIRYYELLLERELDRLPAYPLPEGYRFVFYQPGDRESWLTIEQSAKEFPDRKRGLELWEQYFGGHQEELPRRMLFLENEAGEKVATASAYYDVIHGDASGSAWFHWVAVRRDHQGRGLSKPLVAQALRVMAELGYTHAKVPTQTTSWVAVKVYLDLGFLPIPQNAANSYEGWRIARTLTGHPALWEFPPVSMEEITGKSPAAETPKD
jgi:GNAT superfamily N-acetyltransferase